MTGFGSAELKTAHGLIRVEMKTVNHKFLEISSRIPGHLAEQEDAIRKNISEKIRRGKVMLFISAPDPVSFSTKLFLNEDLAKEVHKKITRLQSILQPKEKVSADSILKEVLHYPEVLGKDCVQMSRNPYAKELMRAVDKAILSLDRSKAFEGRSLEVDLKKRLAEITKALSLIAKRLPMIAKKYRDDLQSRMKDFLKEGELDRERLTQEVAQFLKNTDISEEITRLKSHAASMRAVMHTGGELGRRLDFIGQEVLREANTIGSKCTDSAVVDAVITLKSTVEKIREQSANVE